MQRLKRVGLATALVVLALVMPVAAQDTIYLPLIQTGDETGVMDAAAQAIIDGHALPTCTEEMLDELKKMPKSEPDEGKDPKKYKCKAAILSEGPAPNLFPTEEVAPAASNAEAWSFAYNAWQCPPATCTTSQGAKLFLAVVSSNAAWTGNGAWDSYHYQNKIVAGDHNQAITCWFGPTFPLLGVGIGQGSMNSTAYSTPKLILYMYANNSCVVYVTNISWVTTPDGALVKLERCGASQWKAQVWQGGAWVVLRPCGVEAFNYARYLNAGIGAWAYNGDLNNIHFYPNYYHKAAMQWHDNTRGPWFNPDLPSWARDKTTSYYGNQMIVMDAYGGDYTSLAVVKP